jgi:CheY-like chemotaxis protein
VLVVEDEELVRKMARKMLEELGYRVLSAEGPEHAIALSNDFKGTVDLLLTDVVMPKMDGRSLFNLLSKSRPQMRVLYASGYTDDAIVEDCLLTPGVHFLQKPFVLETLANKIRDALDEGD